MARARNHDALSDLYAAVGDAPGATVPELAEALGLKRWHVESLLPGLESAGFLLSEDYGGRLYQYGLASWARNGNGADNGRS